MAAAPRARMPPDLPQSPCVEVAGPDEALQRRLGADRRDHGVGPQRLARGQADARGAVARDLDRGDPRLGADANAGGLGRPRHRPRHGAHPAARQRRGPHGEAVEVEDQRARRARAEPGAQRRVEGQEAAQPIVAKVVLHDVGDVDQHEAQELPEVGPPHPAQAEARARQRPERASPRRPRRRRPAQRRQGRGVAREPPAELVPAGALVPGQPRGASIGLQRQRLGAEGDGGQRRPRGQSVIGERHGLGYARVERVQDVRQGRDAVARRELGRRGAAARRVLGLQHRHRGAAPRQPRGAGQPVGAAADHDHLRGRHRRHASRGPSSRRAGSRPRRCAPARPSRRRRDAWRRRTSTARAPGCDTARGRARGG